MSITPQRVMIWLAVASVWTMAVIVLVVDLWQCH